MSASTSPRCHALWIATGLVAWLSCNSTANTSPISLNYDRPIDVGFACYGGMRITQGGSADPTQPIVYSAMPTTACDFRSQQFEAGQQAPVPLGQEQLIGGSGVPGVSWYGFILNSAPGTLSVTQWDTKPANAFTGADLLQENADPLTPGLNNGIAVGVNPVAVATSKEGCFEVTANAGTCDLSAVDVTSVLQIITPASTSGPPRVDRLQVTNANNVPILARPAAMVGEPDTGTIGVTCPQQPTGIVYIAYPTCHLVAAVDLSSGQIQAGISFATGTPVVVDGSVTCPIDCEDEIGSGGSAGGSAATAGIEPVTIDLFDDTRVTTRRLAIGAKNQAALTIAELSETTSLPTSVSQVALEDDTRDHSLGITSVALSPQIGMGGSGGIIDDENAPGGQFQFIYGVGTDGTVHVADVLNLRKECDTQVDPRLLDTDMNIKQLSCLPVGDPTTPNRRPGATGPGIRLITNDKPISVAIIKGDTYNGDARTAPNSTPTTIIGYFAFVTATTGTTYIVNVNDDYYGDYVDPSNPFLVQIPLAIAHQLRDAMPNRAEVQTDTAVDHTVCTNPGPDPSASSGNEGDPRAPTPPTSQVPSSNVVSAAKQGELPFFHHTLCVGSNSDNNEPVTELEFAAPVRDQGLTYPDLRALAADEVWTLTWEGSLSQDTQTTAVNGPVIRSGQLSVATADGMDMIDETAPFCGAGVEPYDLLQIDGCNPANNNTDCPQGDVCFVHPDSTVIGLGACMAADEASQLADACREYLISFRRFSILHAAAGDLLLIPRRHDLFTSPVDGCTSNAQCQSLANYQDRLADADNPVDDTTAPDPHKWVCAVDPSRAPITGSSSAASCSEGCGSDADCDAGTVCDGQFCVEGVVPPQACVNAPQKYDLRAGEAFTVVGVESGFIHPIIADGSGNCIRNPNAHPFEVGRIPLVAPACDGSADYLTGLKPDGTYDANPCEVSVPEYTVNESFQPGTCNVTSTGAIGSTATPGIRFHNPGLTFTIVNPTYPGDKSCIGDGSGAPGLGSPNIPMVPDNYQMEFEVTAGFTPLNPPIAPTYPVKVLRGPTESIWVLDDGAFVSTTLTEPSTNGKVFRIESVALLIVNLLE